MQQTVEKGLKAFYIYTHKKSAGQTHSVLFLANQTNIPQQYYSFLRKIAPMYVQTKYPDASSEKPSEMFDEKIAIELINETEYF